MKKVLLIFGSSRSNGNTMKAVEAVLDKRDVEIIDLLRHQISHYDYENRNKDDDFISIAEKMVNSDIIVFAKSMFTCYLVPTSFGTIVKLENISSV